jgi:hypothetical protein
MNVQAFRVDVLRGVNQLVVGKYSVDGLRR